MYKDHHISSKSATLQKTDPLGILYHSFDWHLTAQPKTWSSHQKPNGPWKHYKKAFLFVWATVVDAKKKLKSCIMFCDPSICAKNRICIHHSVYNLYFHSILLKCRLKLWNSISTDLLHQNQKYFGYSLTFNPGIEFYNYFWNQRFSHFSLSCHFEVSVC